MQQFTRVTLYKINFQIGLFLVAGLQGLQQVTRVTLYKINFQIGFFGCRVTRIAVGYKGYIFRQDFEQGLFRLQGYMGCSRLQG